jgi:hypothetical protein
MKAAILVAASVMTLASLVGGAAEKEGQSPVPSHLGVGQLPYGVEEVLKLSKAGISEDIIVKYVQNSGTIYNLKPEVLVHLRDEGVSDKVVNTMLDQVGSVPATTSHWSSQQQQAAPVQPQPHAPMVSQVAPNYIQPPQPAPEPAPPPPVSTVHVIPHYRATYAAPVPYWPGYHPYYSGYYSGWYGPRVSVGLGFSFGHSRHYVRCR